MTTEQLIVFCVLGACLFLFIQGKIRYDLIALSALFVVVISGIISPDEAFTGFSHPAVVTVAVVLIISRALSNAGIVDIIAKRLSPLAHSPVLLLGALCIVVTVLSAFMNNVGALALLMPVAIQMGRKNDISPSLLLMPLAFCSLLGGLTTMIGTPPNIIIASYRTQGDLPPFSMFDFSPVGVGLAAAGIVFIVLLSRFMLPDRKKQGSVDELFQIESYLTEVVIPEKSKVIGKTIRDLEYLPDTEIVVIGIVRSGKKIAAPSSFEILAEGDILIVEADSEDLDVLIKEAGLELVGSKELCLEFIDSDEKKAKKRNDDSDECKEYIRADKMQLTEAVVQLESPIIRKNVINLNLRWKYGINLLGVARQGTRLKQRLKSIRFKAGDVLLLQGAPDSIKDAVNEMGCFPLAERELSLAPYKNTFLVIAVFIFAILMATLSYLPIHIALLGAALFMLLWGIVTLNEAYKSVDWPIIILLGAMIPVGTAMEATGGAQLVADKILILSGGMPAIFTLSLLLAATMILSNLINNAAAAVLMAPIAINISEILNTSLDPFLMAVAVGASMPFLTPIGHQSNTLVFGPGGYKFSDYWKLGLPLTIILSIGGVLLISLFWPL
ncbi:SLC13 family permease [Desulfonatronovibrio magnus]|uniref:SLC13 family permease n=1 Tax=Desulfonatronovibrio magnus TaxID=698827 RepID=UPI0005EB8389|nr:SLC13 family permease [Desulfonatronovibrio magnus]